MKLYEINKKQVFADSLEDPWVEIVPNTTDAAGEKHVPVIAIDGDTITVTVGSVEHPVNFGLRRTPSRPNRNSVSEFQEHPHAEKNIVSRTQEQLTSEIISL